MIKLSLKSLMLHELKLWLNYVFNFETWYSFFRLATSRIRIRVPTQIAPINC